MRGMMNVMKPYRLLSRVLCSCSIFCMAAPAFAVDHTRTVGEPYGLAGKRMVFTNWFYVRPGQMDWKDDKGESVYSGKMAAGPWDVKFDSYEMPRGIRLAVQPAERGEPILKSEKPWEAMGFHVRGLIHEGDKFRMWADTQNSKAEKFTCYYESTDGKTWTRPNLGLVEYEGSKENNLYKAVGHYVFLDPNGPPAERYKTIWAARTDPKIIAEYRKRRPISVFAEEEDPGRFHSIRAGVSPDGLNWTELHDPISVEVSDTLVVAYYDQQLKKYVMFTRGQLLGPRDEAWGVANAPTQPAPKGATPVKGKPDSALTDADPAIKKARGRSFLNRRAIGRSETDNFREFPLSELVLQSGADMLPSDTFYTNCKTTIPGAPDHHLLFPAVYHQADDTTSIDVYSSNDSKMWTRLPGSPVLKTADFGQWDGGCVFATPSLVELPDGSWALPYTGFVYPHKYPRGSWRADVGFAIWPKGRLIALEAPEEGSFTTVEFVPPGRKILINAMTERAGSILVEACRIGGTPLPGRTFAEAAPIISDQYRKELTWKGGEGLGLKEGEPVMLRFRMNKAKLFGLDFE